MASIAVTIAGNAVGLVTNNFSLTEDEMSRLVNAYQEANIEGSGHYEMPDKIDRPEPLSIQQVIDRLSLSFVQSLKREVYQIETRMLIRRNNLRYLNIGE